jgi:hypothetical protein
VLQLEGGDVGSADDLVGGVHVAGSAVGLRVAHLWDWVSAKIGSGDVCVGRAWWNGDVACAWVAGYRGNGMSIK